VKLGAPVFSSRTTPRRARVCNTNDVVAVCVRQIPAEATAAESTRPSADLKNNATTDPMESRHANPAGLTLDDFGALNVTEKSNKFEMDYDEPTLPPSLPNLK